MFGFPEHGLLGLSHAEHWFGAVHGAHSLSQPLSVGEQSGWQLSDVSPNLVEHLPSSLQTNCWPQSPGLLL
jgi:hypothetical protein